MLKGRQTPLLNNKSVKVAKSHLIIEFSQIELYLLHLRSGCISTNLFFQSKSQILVPLLPHFFEIHYLYIMWLYDLQFVTCKISVDAFSFLYIKLLLQNLVYLYLVPFLLNHIGNLLAYVAALFVISVGRL